MRFYRIADARHAPESGEGARLHGGRWNSPGRAVIYACETQTGAMLEKLVHTNGRMPKHQVCVTFEAPDSVKSTTLEPSDIPGWDDPDMIASRKAGDAWLAKAPTAVLRVPSVVFDVERNVLINPEHPEFRRFRVVGIEPVRWDERLFAEK
jgi:RES domain-containing protein